MDLTIKNYKLLKIIRITNNNDIIAYIVITYTITLNAFKMPFLLKTNYIFTQEGMYETALYLGNFLKIILIHLSLFILCLCLNMI